MPNGQLIKYPMGGLGKDQLKRLEGKERKMIQPNRDRDKHKPNLSPTLTPSQLSLKLPLKVDNGL